MEEEPMRALVVGAGTLGGYFGGCLHRAGRDVTFLVRPPRAKQLSGNGLQIIGPQGNFTEPVRLVLADDLRGQFDLILLTVKAYSLNEAMDQLAPAVGPTTVIVPLLNGMAHLGSLSARFGAERMMGGTAIISGTLDSEGRVVLFLPNHDLTFGELAGGTSDRTSALLAFFVGAGFNARASTVILQDMWEKWTNLSTTAGITCLMRASLGDILATPGGRDAILGLFNECRMVASAAGFAPRPAFVEFCVSLFTREGSPMKASMLRDIERGAATEGEHVLGDLVNHARSLGVPTPILDLAYTHLATYERTRRAA